jgi:hypothetical protein
LVIAGGGGGAHNVGAGGGAGGYRTSVGTSGGGASAEASLGLFTSTNYTVTVGAGGAVGTPGNGSELQVASNGASSTFATVTSAGGGGGAPGGNLVPNSKHNPNSGGSGGGASAYAPDGSPGPITGGAGTTGQGFKGGNSTSSGNAVVAAGGGGAGGAANNASGSSSNFGFFGTVGGIGVASTITGSSVTRASGGSGGRTSGASAGGGGACGFAGTTNTGGGGGGDSDTALAGAGGSGVVVIRYPSTFVITGGAGLTFSTAAVGANHVTTFTAGTGTIQLVPAQQAFVLLESVVLTSSQASVEFTNLVSKYAASYQHLQIRALIRVDDATLGSFGFRANSISSNIYSRHDLSGEGASVTTSGAASENIGFLGTGANASTPANVFTGMVIDILDPFETKNKTVRTFMGTTGIGVRLVSSAVYTTDSLSQFQIRSRLSGSIVTGSRFSLYGIRGS